MNEPTSEKLYAMRLGVMAEAWQAQSKDAKVASLTFDERFALLVDAEYLARDNRRLGRLLKDAQLRLPSACIEDIDTSPARGVDKATVRQLGACSWVHEHLGILLCGPTGVGKSYLACAFGQSACRRGHRVLYRRASPGCSTSSRSRVPRAPARACWHASRRSTSSSSTTGAWARSRKLSVTISSRSWRTATDVCRPS